MKTVKKTTVDLYDVTFPSEKQLPKEKGKPDPPILMTTHHFTTNDRPVTHGGKQYIPIGSADAEKWLKEQLK